ncbi:MAG TPA: hypothetical protein DHV93_05170 [Holophagaceae bacterium]|jgi:YHS domain-containing protein|nr:hypothetical protein [Holophagaceae bacterium]
MLHAALLTLAVLAAPAAPKAKPATNTLDPVCKMKVEPKWASVTVRGQEYKVCSKHCATSMEKNPDKYLNQDGSVKAEKK